MSIVVVSTLLALALGPSHFNIDDDEGWGMRAMNRLYFVLATVSTVGYGTIAPRTVLAKSLSMAIMTSMLLTLSNE